jgi:hypothetical protein
LNFLTFKVKSKSGNNININEYDLISSIKIPDCTSCFISKQIKQ